jgi:hypothetical protein
VVKQSTHDHKLEGSKQAATSTGMEKIKNLPFKKEFDNIGTTVVE